MKNISVKGFKNNQEIEIKIGQLFLGSADFLRKDNMDEVKKMFELFLTSKGNGIDTAEHYRHSEIAIGAWLKETKAYDKIVILTKGCHPKREARDVKRVNAACIKEDIEHSLKTLGVDHIDLFALHRDDESVDVKEIMDELNRQINLGHIYAAGVSNWKLDRIIEANNYAKKHNLHPLTFNSVNFSLARPTKPRWPGCVSADDAMIKWHQENDVALISWSAQAGGFFSGRYDRNHCDDKEIEECFYTKENWQRYDRCVELAKQKNYSPIQIALAWVLNQNFKVAAIVGCETIQELKSSILASEIKLTAKELAYLDLKEDTYE